MATLHRGLIFDFVVSVGMVGFMHIRCQNTCGEHIHRKRLKQVSFVAMRYDTQKKRDNMSPSP